MNIRLLISLAMMLIISACATTKPEYRETAMLNPEPGFRGDKINAQVVKVENESPNNQKIELMLPEFGTSINSLVVRDSEGKEIRQSKPYEVINDPDTSTQGVILYLDKKHSLPFKINFNDQPDN